LPKQVHQSWVTAHLYGEKIFIGVLAVTQGFWQRILLSSSEQWGVLFAVSSTVGSDFCPEQSCSALMMGHCTPILRENLDRCFDSDTRLLVSLFCRAALSKWVCFLP